MKKRRKKSRSFVAAWILGGVSLMLSICLVGAVLAVHKLHRNNMFSRAVLLDNNYFMANGAVAPEETSEEEVQVPLDAYIDAEIEEGKLYYSTYLDYIDEAMETVNYIKDNCGVDLTSERWFIDEIVYIYSVYGLTVEAERIISDSLYTVTGFYYDLSGIREPKSITLDLPYISQEGILPNGCEAVSATMLLRYYGFQISAEDFVDGYLDMKPVSIRWGCRYGPNPKYFYAGDPRSEKGGWGCFAPVIERALNKYLSEGYTAKNTTGQTLNTLKEKYVANGIPVAVWVTVDMEEVDRILQWQSEDREETFLYPANEHCMVMIGFDSENYIFADPYESRGVVSYPIDDCVLAFNSLGMQSVVVIEE